jgi:hypothetical protein
VASDFRVDGANQLDALAKRLRGMENGKVMRKSLTKRLGAAAKPLIPEIRSAVKGIPSHGARGSAHDARAAQTRSATGNLRDSIARAVQQKTSLSGKQVGVRLRVDGSKMPAGQEQLPAYMEGIKPWRHPLFGNRHDWYRQSPHPFFWKTIQPHVGAMRSEVAEVLNDVAEQITHGTHK